MYAQYGGGRRKSGTSGEGGDGGGAKAAALRKKGGRWLQQKRKEAELTQLQLAVAVGFKAYTFISQIEGGSARIPPDIYEAYAKALGIDLKDFVKAVLMYYDPFTYKALHGTPTMKDLQRGGSKSDGDHSR